MAGEIVASFCGNLTQDPVQNQAGTATRFTVACTPRVKNRQTNAFENGETSFISVTAFGSLGTNVMQSLRRGSRVVVVGRMSHHTYTTEGGENRVVTQAVADYVGPEITFTPARHAEGQQAPRQAQAAPPQQGGSWSGPPQGGQAQTAPGDPWATAGQATGQTGGQQPAYDDPPF